MNIPFIYVGAIKAVTEVGLRKTIGKYRFCEVSAKGEIKTMPVNSLIRRINDGEFLGVAGRVTCFNQEEAEEVTI